MSGHCLVCGYSGDDQETIAEQAALIERLQAERDHFEFAANSCASFSDVAIRERDARIAAETLKRQQVEHERDVMLEDLASLQAKLAESERDALRYRWLRERLCVTDIHGRKGQFLPSRLPLDQCSAEPSNDYEVEVDAAIDTAITSSSGEG